MVSYNSWMYSTKRGKKQNPFDKRPALFTTTNIKEPENWNTHQLIIIFVGNKLTDVLLLFSSIEQRRNFGWLLHLQLRWTLPYIRDIIICACYFFGLGIFSQSHIAHSIHTFFYSHAKQRRPIKASIPFTFDSRVCCVLLPPSNNRNRKTGKVPLNSFSLFFFSVTAFYLLTCLLSMKSERQCNGRFYFCWSRIFWIEYERCKRVHRIPLNCWKGTATTTTTKKWCLYRFASKRNWNWNSGKAVGWKRQHIYNRHTTLNNMEA